MDKLLCGILEVLNTEQQLVVARLKSLKCLMKNKIKLSKWPLSADMWLSVTFKTRIKVSYPIFSLSLMVLRLIRNNLLRSLNTSSQYLKMVRLSFGTQDMPTKKRLERDSQWVKNSLGDHLSQLFNCRDQLSQLTLEFLEYSSIQTKQPLHSTPEQTKVTLFLLIGLYQKPPKEVHKLKNKKQKVN